MEETGLENMTENTEKEKVLSKEEIVAALNERHSPEKQKLLSAGRVAIAGLGGLGSNVAYALARIGLGIAFVPDYCIPEEEKNLFIVNLEEELPTRQMVVAHNENVPISQAARQFMEML